MNHEEQYSIWLAGKQLPSGWRSAGKEGLKAECLEHIDKVWVDMRPLSLRRKWMQLPGSRQRIAAADVRAQENR